MNDLGFCGPFSGASVIFIPKENFQRLGKYHNLKSSYLFRALFLQVTKAHWMPEIYLHLTSEDLYHLKN